MNKNLEFNFNTIIKYPEKEYNDFIENIKKDLILDFKTTFKNYSYKKKDENERTFLKDKIVKVEINDTIYEMNYGNFLTILICFKIINYYILLPDVKEIDLENFLFDPSNLDEINNYYNQVYSYFEKCNSIKKRIFLNLSEITNLTSYFASGTISIYSLVKLMENDKEFDKHLHFNLKTKTVSEMIKEKNENFKYIEKVLKETDNPYKNFINSGSGIKLTQFSQVINIVGPKPDEFGKIDSNVINNNFIRGINREDFVTNAKGCRKSLITNFTKVKDSGYLTRKCSLLSVDEHLANSSDKEHLSDVKRCNTLVENYPLVNIDCEDTLKRYENRYYYDELTKQIELVGNNQNLIGKKIRVASPITCSCKDGICHTCYGKLSETTNSQDNIGLVAVLLFTDPITNGLLATKHDLEAKINKIDFDEDFKTYFSINVNKIYFSGRKLNKIRIKEVTEDEEEKYITKVEIGKSVIEFPIKVKPTKFVSIDFNSNGEYELLYNESFYNTEENPVFEFVLDNKEMSKTLSKILELIDTNKIKDRNYTDNLNYFIDLLNKSHININSEHIEIILRNLMKINDRQEFAENTNPIYEFEKLPASIIDSNASIKGILFEELQKQLLNPKTYLKKNKNCLFDFLL